MRFRPLGLFILIAGVVILAGQLPLAEAQTKAEKLKAQKAKAQKLKALKLKAEKRLKRQQKRGAEPEPATPIGPPADPYAQVKLAPPPLSTKDAAALANLIDTYIDKKLAQADMPASPLSNDAEFLRRVYLDLTGVIPTPEQAAAFLDSTDPNKRARLIDELLASPNFGKRLSDIWQAKLLTRDSTNRFVLREPFIKWLAESFNKNLPWDRFAYEVVTAAGSVNENPAVTFFLSNRAVDKLTDSVSQNFLGIQLQCAQCHNHPFTTWKQTEYWGMATFFSKVQPQNPKNANKGADNSKLTVSEGVGKARLKDFFPESTKVVPPKYLGSVEANLPGRDPYRPALGKWMTDPRNPYFSRAMVNRTWALLFGTGFVNPIDDMLPENPASHPELLDALSRQFSADGFDVKHLYRAICNSKAYQRTSKPLPENKNDDGNFSHMTIKVMTPEQLYDSLNQVTSHARVVQAKGKPAQAKKGQRANARDQFVQFFLAGAEVPNPTEYEAGIPQALRLMNSRVLGNPNLARGFFSPGDDPATVIEKLYLVTLSRRPTPEEMDRLTTYTKSNTAVEAYSDILWALMNCSEFTMIR